MFHSSADLYDLIYSFKDYQSEADKLIELINSNHPTAKSILDVACGTSEHHKYLSTNFQITGLDISPDFINISKSKNPNCSYAVADMSSFDLGQKFDIVTCLFSSIAYVKTTDKLLSTIASFKNHMLPDGLLIIEPWVNPAEWVTGKVHMQTYESDAVKICRMSISGREDNISVLNFDYLVGQRNSLQHFQERHLLGLFDQATMMEAFEQNGLIARFIEGGLMGRGLYLVTKE